jgi:hypothetical protein
MPYKLARFLRHAPEGCEVQLIADYVGDRAPDIVEVLDDRLLELRGELSEDWMVWRWDQQGSPWPELQMLSAMYVWEEGPSDEPDDL